MTTVRVAHKPDAAREYVISANRLIRQEGGKFIFIETQERGTYKLTLDERKTVDDSKPLNLASFACETTDNIRDNMESKHVKAKASMSRKNMDSQEQKLRRAASDGGCVIC
jgi:transglutaminase/protease-like cytokinesis protein 3